jgi:hypothetical protein
MHYSGLENLVLGKFQYRSLASSSPSPTIGMVGPSRIANL